MSLNLSIEKYTHEQEQIWEQVNVEGNSSFLTSIKWIEFQKSIGKITDQYLIKNNNEYIGNIYIEISNRKISKYAYAPYGPVINYKAVNNQISEVFKFLSTWQVNYARSLGLNCFRMDPLIALDKKNILTHLGYKTSMAPTQAKYVWEIDLKKPEDELFADMKKVARYNIRSSEKVGIEIIKATKEEHVIEFVKILNQTTQRHNFKSFSQNYFINQFNSLNNNLFNLYLAKYKDRFISAALINTYNSTGYYSHGGSLNDKETQKYGASYLLHWFIIKDLKQNGFDKYNMWGVIPDGMKVDNGMQGVSEFKKRFGGIEKDYVGGLDLPSNPMYFIQRLAEKYIYRKDRY